MYPPLTQAEESELVSLLSENYVKDPKDRKRYRDNAVLPRTAERIGDLLYRQFYRRMLNDARRYVRFHEDAADLLQDAFILFFERGSFQCYNSEQGTPYQHWFTVVYHNAFKELWKKRSRHDNVVNLDQEVPSK